MSSAYTIQFPDGTYFLTSTIIGWVDVFSRKKYRDILLDSLTYCIENKNLKLHGYVIMSSHIHWIASAELGFDLSKIVADMKKFTSKEIFHAIENEAGESRREWMLNLFRYAGKLNSNNKNFQVWQNDNHAEIIFTEKFFTEKLNYIHNNPVRAAIVERPEDYLYSSARDYVGQKGMIKIEPILVKEYVR